MNTAELASKDTELNSLVRKGEILDGIEQHYADDCTFQEGNNEPIRGKATQLKRLSEMFEGLKSFDGATLHSQAVGDGVTLTEWTFNMTSGEGDPIVWNEVLARQWNAGKVVRERYYQA
jgi:ketosteroid isomerase-like protein